MGGLLSAYALSKDQLFLDKALLLGRYFLPAFDTKTGIPLNSIDM